MSSAVFYRAGDWGLEGEGACPHPPSRWKAELEGTPCLTASPCLGFSCSRSFLATPSAPPPSALSPLSTPGRCRLPITLREENPDSRVLAPKAPGASPLPNSGTSGLTICSLVPAPCA